MVQSPNFYSMNKMLRDASGRRVLTNLSGKNRAKLSMYKRVQRLMHEAGLMGKRPKEKYHLILPKARIRRRLNAC